MTPVWTLWRRRRALLRRQRILVSRWWDVGLQAITRGIETRRDARKSLSHAIAAVSAWGASLSSGAATPRGPGERAPRLGEQT